MGNIAGRGDGATSKHFLMNIDVVHVLILIHVQRTKNQFPRLIGKFIQIGKLTKKDEPAILCLN